MSNALEDGLAKEPYLRELISVCLSPNDLDLIEFFYASVKGRRVDPRLFSAEEGASKRRVLWHTSDEKMRHRGQMYRSFDAVIRNHFDPRMGWKKNVVTFPLGYLSGFVGEPRMGNRTRKYFWAFCGAGYKKKRKDMLDVFADFPNGYLRLSSGWSSAPGDLEPLSQQELASVYAESDFVLCPVGINHPDTFRIMEALQAGAIPVMVKFLGRDYAKYTFGKHPFVVASTWAEAAEILRGFHDNPDRIAEKRKEVNEWYASYRQQLLHNFHRIVTSDVPAPRDWEVYRIQRRARWNFLFMIQVWRRFHPTYRTRLENRDSGQRN